MVDLICEWVHIVDIYFASALKYYVLGKNFKKTGLGLWCSMPLSTIFQFNRSTRKQKTNLEPYSVVCFFGNESVYVSFKTLDKV